MTKLPQPILTSLGLLILRLGIAGFMLSHGVGKLRMLFAGEAETLGDPVGIGSLPTLLLLIFAEFLCAGLVLLGLVTRLAAIPLVIAMGVAGFVAHAGDPFTADAAAQLFFAGDADFPASRQPALTFMIVFLALVFTGPGRFSLDALLFTRRDRTIPTAD